MKNMSNSLAYDDDNGTYAGGELLRNFQSYKNEEGLLHPTQNSGLRYSRPAQTEHPVWVVNVHGRLKSLDKPLVFRVTIEGDHYFAENVYLNISVYGSTPYESLSEATKDIAYYYAHYSNLDDDNLIGFGLELKERYSKLFD